MTNKTYSEEKGKEPFNWPKALRKRNINWVDLRTLSKSWTTCACGNQCSIIPRDGYGKPKDAILSLLGGRNGFHRAILYHDKKEALEFLEAIEQRSAFLISQMEEKKEVEELVKRTNEL